MNPLVALAIADALLTSGLRIWGAIEGKPEGWTPTETDWQRLRAANSVTAADFEAGQQRLDIPPS